MLDNIITLFNVIANEITFVLAFNHGEMKMRKREVWKERGKKGKRRKKEGKRGDNIEHVFALGV